MRQRTTTKATEINKHSVSWNKYLSGNSLTQWEQLATDQFDPWQVIPGQVFTPYSCLLISTAFDFVSHVGCLGVIGARPCKCGTYLVCIK